jgi:hypothetical protein
VTDSSAGGGFASLGSLLNKLNPFVHSEKKQEQPPPPPQIHDAYDELRTAITATFIREKSRQSFKEADQLKTRQAKLKSQPRDTTFQQQLSANLQCWSFTV